MPGQLHYEMINVLKRGNRWFCTEEEAQAQGWRKAAR
jgi:hypothetical protein